MESQYRPQPPTNFDLTGPGSEKPVPSAAAPGGYRPAAPGGRPPMPPGGYRPGPGVPYPGPVPRKPAKKGPGIGTRIILRCIAVLLSLVLFATLLVGILIYDGKELLDADNLYTLLDELGLGFLHRLAGLEAEVTGEVGTYAAVTAGEHTVHVTQ